MVLRIFGSGGYYGSSGYWSEVVGSGNFYGVRLRLLQWLMIIMEVMDTGQSILSRAPEVR